MAQKHRGKKTGGSSQKRSPSTTSAPPSKHGGLATLQKSAGNRAVANTIATVKQYSDEELLQGELLTVGHPQYPRQVKLRMAQRRRRREMDNAGYLTKLWNAMPSLGTWSWGAPEEDEEEELGVRAGEIDDLELGDLTPSEGSGESSSDFWKTESPTTEDPAEEAPQEASGGVVDGLLDQVVPKEVVITLLSAAGARDDTALGKVSGSTKVTTNQKGEFKGGAKGKAEGRYGKVEGELNASSAAERLEGDGKVAFEMGRSGEHRTSTLDFATQGATLRGAGKLEGFAGLKLEASGGGGYDRTTGDVTMNAKLGGLLGSSTDATTTIRVLLGEEELGTYEGKLGLTIGLGGEYNGTLTWTTGSLVFGMGGKLALGVGLSYGYKVEIKTQNLMKTVGSGVWSWLSWMTEGASEEDFWL